MLRWSPCFNVLAGRNRLCVGTHHRSVFTSQNKSLNITIDKEAAKLDYTRERVQNILNPGFPFSSAVTDGEFLALYRQAQENGEILEIYRAADNLISHSPAPSGLVWFCVLQQLLIFNDTARFVVCYRRMLESQHCLNLIKDQNFLLWQEAVDVVGTDAACLKVLFEHVQNAGLASIPRTSRIYMSIMVSLLRNATEIDLPTILTWHATLLENNFLPDEGGRADLMEILCDKSFSVNLVYRIAMQFDAQNLKFDILSAARQELRKQDRDTKEIDDLLQSREQERFRSNSTLVESTIRQYVKYDPPTQAAKAIEQILLGSPKLNQNTQGLIGYFYGKQGDYENAISFCREQYILTDAQAEDDFWSSVVAGALAAERPLLDVLRKIQQHNARIGSATLQRFAESAKSLKQSEILIKHILEQNMKINLRGYAVFIRHVAKSGAVHRAERLINVALDAIHVPVVSEADATYLRRCLLLGLLESRNFGKIEQVHAMWCQHKLDSADTWNLLIRSRIVDRRVQSALQALRQIETRGLDVENATAQEFVQAVLRRRRPGHNPDVLDASDRRPYLKDIKTAISIAYKCLQLGGRTQPETWREIIKRFSLYGEFEALKVLTDWLIPQYSPGTKGPDSKRYYIYSADQKRLATSHAQHPLSRLVRQRDAPAIMTRGFVNNTPIQALTLLVKWQSMGVYIDRAAIAKRIKVGLEYLEKELKMSEESVRALEEQLQAILEEMT